MDRVPPQVIRAGLIAVAWICFGAVVRRTLGIQTLQLYVIATLLFGFVWFGTSGRRRRPGEPSPYEFLNPADPADLQAEVVPFVAPERLRAVLLTAPGAALPSETTPAGAQLRRLASRADLSLEQMRGVVRSLRLIGNGGGASAPAPNAACLCGGNLQYRYCCEELVKYLRGR